MRRGTMLLSEKSWLVRTRVERRIRRLLVLRRPAGGEMRWQRFAQRIVPNRRPRMSETGVAPTNGRRDAVATDSPIECSESAAAYVRDGSCADQREARCSGNRFAHRMFRIGGRVCPIRALRRPTGGGSIGGCLCSSDPVFVEIDKF